MKAVCWYGKHDVRVRSVPDPKIINPRDAIVRVTSTAICGSDLHLYNGFIPTMEPGDILGHEFMGEVVEVGRERSRTSGGRRSRRRAVPDRLRPLLLLRSASCASLLRQLQSERVRWRRSCTAHAGGPVRLLAPDRRLRRRSGRVRARAVRRRRAAQGPGRPDRRAGAVPLRHPADRLHGGGELRHRAPATSSPCGAAGRSASSRSRSALLLGAERVIAIDRFAGAAAPRRRSGARRDDDRLRADGDVVEALKELTGGRGPDACIDAVGMEAHGTGAARRLRPREAGDACSRPIGRPRCARRSWPAARAAPSRSPASTAGFVDKFPIGALIEQGPDAPRRARRTCTATCAALLERIEAGGSIRLHHHAPPAARRGARGLRDVHAKKDECIKVVLRPS